MAGDDIIEEAVVRIGPDLDGFRRKLRADLDKAMAGVAAKVKLTADATGFNKLAREAIAKQAALKNAPTYAVKLVADAAGFNRSVKDALSGYAATHVAPEYKVKLVADSSGLGALGGRGGRASGAGSQTKAEQEAKKAQREAEKAIRILYSRIREPEEKFEAAQQVATQSSVRRLVNSFDDALTKAHLQAFEEDKRFLDKMHTLAASEEKTRAASSGGADADAQKRAVTHVRDTAEVVQRAELQAHAAQLNRVRSAGEAITKAEEAAYAEEDRRVKAALDKQERDVRSSRNSINRAERSSIDQRAKMWKSLTGGQDIIDFGGSGIRPMNLLYAAAVALSPALIAVSASAAQASTSVAALGAAGIGATLGIGGLVVAFTGLTDLLALRKTAKAEETANAANAVINANAVLDAVNAELQAEKDLHDARREAARDLVDLKQKVADLQNQQKEDTVSVAEAQANRDKVYRNYFSSALDRARAQQDLNNARQRQSDNNLSAKENKQDLADSVKKGVEGSDKVVKARENLRQARARAAQATSSGGSGKASSAAANLADKLAKSSPALRELYTWIDKNSDAFTKLANQIQQAFLPGFTTFLKEVSAKPAGGKSTLQFFTDQSAQLGKIISGSVADIGKFTQSPLFREAFASIQTNNATALGKLSDAMLVLARPVLRILDKASPLLVRFADGFADFADWLDKVIAKADKSGALAKWFDDAGTQMGHWIGIAKNLLSILGSIFKAALPSGGSLVERLQAFTKTMADWAKSGKGQDSMKRFFEFFQNLPYGDLTKSIVAATELFVAIKLFNFVRSGPMAMLFTALTGFLAAHPAGAAVFMQKVSDGLALIVGTLAAHPAEAALLTAMFAGKKIASTVGFDLKIPVITQLKNALVSKFSVLDKVFGGSASTATMTVHAGVVNLYGAVAGGAALTPGGKTTVVGGVPAGTAADAEKGVKSGVRTFAGSIALMVGAAVGASLVESIGAGSDPNSFKGQLTSALSATLSGTLIGATFGPIGAAAGAVIGLTVNQVAGYYKAMNEQGEKERSSAENVHEDAYRYSFGAQVTPNDPRVLTRKFLLDYIETRKKSVRASMDAARATGGEAAANKVLETERAKSVNTLASMLREYGYTAQGAQDAAAAMYGYAANTGKATTASDKNKTATQKATGAIAGFGASAENTDGKIQSLNARTGVLKETMDGVVGGHTIQIDVDGYDDTYKKLSDLWNIQHVLYNPSYSNSTTGADTVSGQNQYLDPITGKPRAYMKAQGGPIIGAGTATSDSIPAWLSNGEYVLPTKAVQHYGVGMLESMRQRQWPAFAQGGQAGTWPVKVNVKNIPVPDLAAYTPAIGGGDFGGDTGVAELAEAAARAAGATDKQLVALISAGIVESGLKNLTRAVDHDSLGFLQQRPSQGWGSPAQITDVAYATRSFIRTAKAMDKPALSAGELAARVQRPDPRYRGRYAEHEVQAASIINRLAPYLSGYVPTEGAGAGVPTKASLIAFGRSLQLRGYTVSENPAFGPVGKHADGSKHYLGRAIDVNHGAGTSALEQSYLAKIIPEAHRLGFRTIFMQPGHYNHAHIDFADGGQVPARVPARKYDTGGTLPPGYTLAFNGTGRNETIRTHTQEKALGGGQVRLHRADIALLAQHIAGASNQQITMDGRKVAEVTHSYTYLPAGV